MTFEEDKQAILSVLDKLPYARFTIDVDGEVLVRDNGTTGRTFVYLDNTVWLSISNDQDKRKHIDRDKVYDKHNIDELFDLMFIERI